MLGYLPKPPPPNPSYATAKDYEVYRAEMRRIACVEGVGNGILLGGLILSIVLGAVILLSG